MTCTNSLRSLAALSLLAPSLFGVVACGNEDPDGSITINYQLGLSNMCETLDVQTIRVDIGEGKETKEAPCDPNEGIEIDDVKAGSYALRVTGIDSQGITVMDNLDAPTSDDSVEIVGGSDREQDVSLSATPASVGVKWLMTFDGEPTECSFLVTKTFEVTTYADQAPVLSHNFDCVKPPGFVFVPDEERQISGQQLDGVRVRLLDDGDAMLTQVVSEFEPPGPGRTVELTLNCDEVNEMVTCEITTEVSGSTDPTAEPTTGPEPTSGGDSTAGDTSG